MTVIKSEFFLALNQVATERGISIDDVLTSIQEAVLAAYKKDYGDDEEAEFEAKINKDTGETHVFKNGKDITPPGFGRIAAQTARQVILQKIREAEKREIVKHFTAQVGTIVKGRVIRFDPKNVHFDIGKAEGVLPASDRIRSEDYSVNRAYTLYILKIEEDDYANSRIVLSRTNPKLVEKLFEKEVPEIASGTVKVHAVVREPGERAKIAVFSDQAAVDPVGACVGQKGIRVKAVNDELGSDEKIDIIQYNADDEFFVREALSPAKVETIELDREKKVAKVFVTQEQAPLAIGRGGVNVNLAGLLTGYEIDVVQIESETKVHEEVSDDKEKVDESVEVQAEETTEAADQGESNDAKDEEVDLPETKAETPNEDKAAQS